MSSGKNWAFWGRAGCLVVTGIALWAVFRRLRLDVLLHTFKTLHWGWFTASVTVYGALFVPAAARWHLVLRLSNLAVGKAATMRFTLIGHLFYTLFFGSVGGDSIKAVLYARRFRFPLASTLATAPLDRFLGSVGMIIFAVLSIVIALETGGLKTVGSLSISHGAWWWCAAVLAAVILIWSWRGKNPESLWGRFVSAFRRNGRALLGSPAKMVFGVFLGFLVQTALCAVIALNLRAVCDAPLPWMKMLWTFPVIVAISALPISVGGLGTREGAALTFLGLYGVPETQAVAASLLTMVAILFWAAAAAGLFLMEFGFSAGLKGLAEEHPPDATLASRAQPLL